MFRLINRPEQESEPLVKPQPPRQPDYLLILMIGLFLLALLIAFMTDVPALIR
jgi:hypothetical protein